MMIFKVFSDGNIKKGEPGFAKFCSITKTIIISGHLASMMILFWFTAS